MKKKSIHNINESGFKVPKDYFNTIESAILNQIKFEEVSSNESGFKVPKDYFNSLEKRITENIIQKESSKVITLFNRRNLIYISGIAAAILLLFNLSIFENNVTFDSLDIETVENYIIDEDVSSYEIASLLNDEDLTEDDFVDYNFNEETIETYILNNIDVDDLIVE